MCVLTCYCEKESCKNHSVFPHFQVVSLFHALVFFAPKTKQLVIYHCTEVSSQDFNIALFVDCVSLSDIALHQN